MTTNKQEKINLDRFGCSLRENTGVFCIDWRGRPATQAVNASIFALLARVSTEAGPIVLIGLEISPVRPLPSYFYFPFDLKKRLHRDHLSRLTETGEIRLSFFAGKEQRRRAHQLSPYLRGRSAEGYAEALQELGSIEPDKYDFAKALLLLEHHVRIPELMQRILVEDSIREISEKVDKMLQTVPNENRETARNCIREVAEPFLSYYRNNRNQFLENLQVARRGSTLVLDFHRIFVDKPEALNTFLSDALAVSFSRQELEKLSDQAKFFVSLTKLPFKEQSPSAPLPADAPSVPELPAGLGALVQSMAGSGISKESTSRFFELMGLKVGGKPGRPVKDYSREYESKASGLSWTEVARKALRENPEFREEFGERDFQSLTFEEQENLKNRLREGVRSYAERTGKPFPIETVESIADQDKPARK